MSEAIIDFTRTVWRAYFPGHEEAPKTLCYDPLSFMPETHHSLCHIAYDSIYMHDFEHDPDSRIWYVDSCSTELDFSEIECVVFASFENQKNMTQLLNNLVSASVIIVINECVQLPREWAAQDIEIDPRHGRTVSCYEGSSYKPKEIKNIKAYLRV